jgi:5-(carboxyamino)imidazole ribonucleotide mutase
MTPNPSGPLVGILMGSKSDWDTMLNAAKALDALGISYEVNVMSAHRTPTLVDEYVSGAEARGLEVIIAGAGGAAHLAGVSAARTLLPVLGVPIQSKALNGMTAVSTVQMPAGIPVMLAIGNAIH